MVQSRWRTGWKRGTQADRRGLQLERLEERVVPSPADGTILVANAGISPWSDSDPLRISPVGLSLGVSPHGLPIPTGEGGTFRGNATEGLWSDDAPRAILAVNPTTGAQFLVSTGGFLCEPT